MHGVGSRTRCVAVRLAAAACLLVQQLCSLVEQLLLLMFRGRGLRGMGRMLLRFLQSNIPI